MGISIGKWREVAGAILEHDHGTDFETVDISVEDIRSAYDDDESPREFIDRFASKYDLTTTDYYTQQNDRSKQLRTVFTRFQHDTKTRKGGER